MTERKLSSSTTLVVVVSTLFRDMDFASTIKGRWFIACLIFKSIVISKKASKLNSCDSSMTSFFSVFPSSFPELPLSRHLLAERTYLYMKRPTLLKALWAIVIHVSCSEYRFSWLHLSYIDNWAWQIKRRSLGSIFTAVLDIAYRK